MVLLYSQLNPYLFTKEELVDEKGRALKAVALDITKSIHEYSARIDELSEAWVMALVQRSWCISEKESQDVDLVFATFKWANDRRLILGAFRFGRDGKDHFIKTQYTHDDATRRIFLAEPVESFLRKKYVGNYLDDTPGARNPIRYYENQ